MDRDSPASILSQSGSVLSFLRPIPNSPKLRLKLTAGSVDSFTNLVGASGSGIFFLCPATIRARPRERREVALRFGAVSEA